VDRPRPVLQQFQHADADGMAERAEEVSLRLVEWDGHGISVFHKSKNLSFIQEADV
jgi:hypothetical protein